MYFDKDAVIHVCNISILESISWYIPLNKEMLLDSTINIAYNTDSFNFKIAFMIVDAVCKYKLIAFVKIAINIKWMEKCFTWTKAWGVHVWCIKIDFCNLNIFCRCNPRINSDWERFWAIFTSTRICIPIYCYGFGYYRWWSWNSCKW